MKNLLASALRLSASSVVISPLCHLHCNAFLAATMRQPCQAVPVIQTELTEGIPPPPPPLLLPPPGPVSWSGDENAYPVVLRVQSKSNKIKQSK